MDRNRSDHSHSHCSLGHGHVQVVQHLVGVLLLSVRLEGMPHGYGGLCVPGSIGRSTPCRYGIRMRATIVVCGRHRGVCGNTAMISGKMN